MICSRIVNSPSFSFFLESPPKELLRFLPDRLNLHKILPVSSSFTSLENKPFIEGNTDFLLSLVATSVTSSVNSLATSHYLHHLGSCWAASMERAPLYFWIKGETRVYTVCIIEAYIREWTCVLSSIIYLFWCTSGITGKFRRLACHRLFYIRKLFRWTCWRFIKGQATFLFF